MATVRSVVALVAAVVVAACVALAAGGPSCFNHQTETYTSHFKMETVTGHDARVTPFFSPGQLEREVTELVLSAESSIDIAVASWAPFQACGVRGGGGCSPAQLRYNASSPLFVALVNAIHSGVRVRLLVGYCSTNVNPPGAIDVFSYLALAGASVRAYATTDFIHSKYVNVDNRKVAIMSANFDLEGFLYNREAGVVYDGLVPGSPVADFTTAVFDGDWELAIAYPVDATWPASVLKLMKDKSPIPMPPVTFTNSTCSYNVPDPPPTFSAEMDVTVYTMPDDGVELSLIPHLQTATTSIDVYIYVIASRAIVAELIALKQSRPKLRIRALVSGYVVPGPFASYPAAYRNLTSAGIEVHVTHDCLGIHHQKYWIVDGSSVSVSTNNWAESEYPTFTVFPPGVHGADRGLTLRFTHPGLVAWYASVMDADWKLSEPWTPSLVPPPPPPPSVLT